MPELDPMVVRAQERVGSVLVDKWRLDALLGVGGMAAVYAATHRNQKRVAVKVLHPELCGDKDVRTRFLSEGYAANAVEHEGAVSVLDDDVAPDGAAFLVMELLDGETLEQRWERKGRRLDVKELLGMTEKLLDVLAAAHAKSIVHRDIKPENLFLTRSGIIKVLDFGIARVFEAQQKQSQTRVGMVMGTPAFMAPEQARARWDEVDGRTDLWAVGATMFTLLSGQYVHEAKTGNEQLIYSATIPARSIGAVVTGLPRSVVATIDRALAFEREKRWPDARAMQDAILGSLEALQSGDAVSSSGPRLSIPGTGVTVAPVPAPTANAAQLRTAVVTWMQERDTRAAEIAKWRPRVAELQPRVAAARKKVLDIESKIAAAQRERASMEQWFSRQVGTRTAAVGEARTEMRQRLAELGRRALADTAAFGEELSASRVELERLRRTEAARSHDVAVHEAALKAHDPVAMKSGLTVAAIAALCLLMLLVVPVVLRLTVPADPPQLTLPPGTPR